MNMKRWLLIITYCLTAFSLSAMPVIPAEPGRQDEQDIIREMAAAAAKAKSIQAKFTQTKHAKMLKAPQVSEGQMTCRWPDKLRWEYTSPRRSALVLDGTKASLSKDGSASGGQSKFATEMARMIMNSVAGRTLTDTTAFEVSAQALPTEYIATLLPLRKEMKRLYTKFILHFNLATSAVNKVELYEKNGDRTVIELHDIRIEP